MSDLPDLHSPFAREPETKGPPKWREAHHYLPSAALVTALELAIDLGQPLLLTGEPGCGKTAAAYWAAWPSTTTDAASSARVPCGAPSPRRERPSAMWCSSSTRSTRPRATSPTTS